MRRCLCITLPNWPIQRLVAARPELEGRPIVLHAPHPRTGETVVACSKAAAALGVHLGMCLAEVNSLFNRDPASHVSSFNRDPQGSAPIAPNDILLAPHDPLADHDGLTQIAAACEEFSPTVAPADQVIARDRVARHEAAKGMVNDSLYLDITGLAPLFGGEPALAARIAKRFRQRRLLARVAMADTFRSAWAIAHYGPSSTVIVPLGQTPAAIEPLPPAALRLDDETLDLLAQLGLTSIGDLLRVPRESLPSRFGPLLLRRLDEALGTAGEAILPFRSPPDFSAAWSLEYPTTRRDLIEHILTHLVRRLAAALTDQNQGAMRLEVSLDCLGGRKVEFEIGLFQPSHRPEHLLDLVRLRLERLALPEAVEQVAMTASKTAPIVARQCDLFAESNRDDPRELARLLDRLASRLGSQSVVCSRLSPSAQPELAYRHEPVVGDLGRRGHRQRQLFNRHPLGERVGAAQTATSALPFGSRLNGRNRRHAQHALPADISPLHRPLLLRSPPTAVEVIAIAPDGPPKMFHDQGEPHAIARHWGPERIETSWWRGRLVRRDYYRVETRAGRRFWLFRRLADGRWFLHGEFE